MPVTNVAYVVGFKPNKALAEWLADKLFSVAIIFIIKVVQRPQPQSPSLSRPLEWPVARTIFGFRVAIPRKLRQAHARSVQPINSARLSRQDELGAQ
jgi:hypothetical protein